MLHSIRFDFCISWVSGVSIFSGEKTKVKILCPLYTIKARWVEAITLWTVHKACRLWADRSFLIWWTSRCCVIGSEFFGIICRFSLCASWKTVSINMFYLIYVVLFDIFSQLYKKFRNIVSHMLWQCHNKWQWLSFFKSFIYFTVEPQHESHEYPGAVITSHTQRFMIHTKMRIHGYLPVQVHSPIPSFKWVFSLNFWEWKL